MKAGISANELMFKLRSRGIYSVEKVKNCIFEQNGQLTVIENDEAWLEKEVQKAGYNSVNDIFLGEYIAGKLLFTGYSK